MSKRCGAMSQEQGEFKEKRWEGNSLTIFNQYSIKSRSVAFRSQSTSETLKFVWELIYIMYIYIYIHLNIYIFIYVIFLLLHSSSLFLQPDPHPWSPITDPCCLWQRRIQVSRIRGSHRAKHLSCVEPAFYNHGWYMVNIWLLYC